MTRIRQHATSLLFLTAAYAGGMEAQVPARHSRYLYVWAGTGSDTVKGVDMMTVLDADPSSRTYGAVRAALAVDSDGRMPHHSEFDAPRAGPLFVNDYNGDKPFGTVARRRINRGDAGVLKSTTGKCFWDGWRYWPSVSMSQFAVRKSSRAMNNSSSVSPKPSITPDFV